MECKEFDSKNARAAKERQDKTPAYELIQKFFRKDIEASFGPGIFARARATLRVGPKGEKRVPRIVYREGNEDEQIMDFLKHRDLIKDILWRGCARAVAL